MVKITCILHNLIKHSAKTERELCNYNYDAVQRSGPLFLPLFTTPKFIMIVHYVLVQKESENILHYVLKFCLTP